MKKKQTGLQRIEKIEQIDTLMMKLTNPASQLEKDEYETTYNQVGKLMVNLNLIKASKVHNIKHINQQYAMWRKKRTEKAIKYTPKLHRKGE